MNTNIIAPPDDRWLENSIKAILALPLPFSFSQEAKAEIDSYIEENITTIPQRLTIQNIEEICEIYKNGILMNQDNDLNVDDNVDNIGNMHFNAFFLEPLVRRSPLYTLYIELFELKDNNKYFRQSKGNVVNFFFPIEFEISNLIIKDANGKKINNNLSQNPLRLNDNLYKSYINHKNNISDKKIGSYYINRSLTFTLLGEMFVNSRNQSAIFTSAKQMFLSQGYAIFDNIITYLESAFVSSKPKFTIEHFNYFISILKNKCELNSLPNYQNNYGFTGECIKKIKLLLMFDNIHDFGKNRGDTNKSDSYHTSNFKNVCNNPVVNNESDFCFINYILKNHIKPLSLEIRPNPSFDFDIWKITRDNKLINSVFSNNWEFELLKNLGSDKEIRYINTTDFYGSNNSLKFITKILIPDKILTNGGDIVNDTISPRDKKLLTSIINFKENGNIVFTSKKLLNSIFDGYYGSTPKHRDNNTYGTYREKISIPFPYNNPTNENIEYLSYTDKRGSHKKNVVRRFPVRFGIGGINKRTSEKSKYLYDRADKVTIEDRGTIDENIDHLITVAKSAKRNLSVDINSQADILFANDISFFITLKALGDFTQLLEAKIRNAVFITQDSIQFIIGAFIGTKMLKVGSDGLIYYANITPPQQSASPSPPKKRKTRLPS